MPTSLKESRALTEAAKVLYRFLPGSGSATWKGHINFATVAAAAGVGDFWPGGSKQRAIAHLLEMTLERRRGKFEPLILQIVREGMRYCEKSGNPILKSEIVALNGLIAEVGFKFPELWDPNFLNTLKSGDAPTEATTFMDEAKEAAKRAAEERRKELELLKIEFFELAKAPNRQDAGLQFEPFLNRLFSQFGLEPRLSYRVTGEQIDGSIRLDSEIYLVEAKWIAGSIGEKELAFFRSKIEGKSSATRGIFIAANGFTKEGLAALVRGKQPNFFLLDGYDLLLALDGKILFDAMLREKLRRLAEEGVLMHRVSTA